MGLCSGRDRRRNEGPAYQVVPAHGPERKNGRRVLLEGLRGALGYQAERGGWSLLGRITFWAAFGLTLMISATVAQLIPWLHFVWVLPLWLGWMLQTQQRDFRRILTVLLDEVADKFHLTKVGKNS